MADNQNSGGINLHKERKFVGREDLIKIFLDTVQDKYGSTEVTESYTTPKVLMFHGIAGIGKSRLKNELMKKLREEKPAALYASVDFQEPNNRLIQNALFYLRATLKSSRKIKFPAFDMAFAIFWSKAYPAQLLNKGSFKFWDESGIVGDILSTAGDAPVIGFIPRVAKTAAKGVKIVKDRWTKHIEPALHQLAPMESHQILERLPYFLAMDIKNHIAESRPPIVLFFDTYEALIGEKRDKHTALTYDNWIRELIKKLPEAFFIFTGRNKISWESHDDECQQWLTVKDISKFDEKLALQYLEENGIEDDDIKNKIYNASEGVPLYLSISLDTFEKIKEKGEELTIDKFGGTHPEILTCFLRNLNDKEQQALEILSAARKFDFEIFEMLMEISKIGYPIGDFNRLLKHSFISSESETEFYLMHELMREHFHKHGDQDIIKKSHKWLYDYYRAMIKGITVKNIPEKANIAAPEMNYHKFVISSIDDWFSWLTDFAGIFYTANHWQVFEAICKDSLNYLSEEDAPIQPNVSWCLNGLALAYHGQGRYEEAEKFYLQAIEIDKKTLGENHPGYALGLNNLAALYDTQGLYEMAEPLYKKAIEIDSNVLGEDHHVYATDLNNLAELYRTQGFYDKAEPLYKKAIEIYKKALREDHPQYAAYLNNLALLYNAQSLYDKAEPLYKQVIGIVKKTLGEIHPQYAAHLNNLALLYIAQRLYNKG